MSQQQYDDQFKQEAIRLATTSPQPIAKTARDLGIKEATLYHWVSAAKDNAISVSNEKGDQVSISLKS